MDGCVDKKKTASARPTDRQKDGSMDRRVSFGLGSVVSVGKIINIDQFVLCARRPSRRLDWLAFRRQACQPACLPVEAIRSYTNERDPCSLLFFLLSRIPRRRRPASQLCTRIFSRSLPASEVSEIFPLQKHKRLNVFSSMHRPAVELKRQLATNVTRRAYLINTDELKRVRRRKKKPTSPNQLFFAGNVSPLNLLNSLGAAIRQRSASRGRELVGSFSHQHPR